MHSAVSRQLPRVDSPFSAAATARGLAISTPHLPSPHPPLPCRCWGPHPVHWKPAQAAPPPPPRLLPLFLQIIIIIIIIARLQRTCRLLAHLQVAPVLKWY